MAYIPTFSFWGIEIEKEAKYTYSPPRNTIFRLSSASLKYNNLSSANEILNKDSCLNSQISVITSGKSVVLCNLKQNLCENFAIDLVFPPMIPITIFNEGNSSISLSGYLQPLSIEQIDTQYLDLSNQTKRANQSIRDEEITEEKDSKNKKLNGDTNFLVDAEKASGHRDSVESNSSNFETKSTTSNDSTIATNETNGHESNTGSKKKKRKSKEKPIDKNSKKDGSQNMRKSSNELKDQNSLIDKVKKQKVVESQHKVESDKKDKTDKTDKTDKKEKNTKPKKDKKNKSKLKNEQNDEANKKKWILRNGIKFFDIVEGSGKEIKKGEFLRIIYATKNSKGKIIDSVIDSQKPFTFKFDQGEVIQGWDIGMKGMKHGGKRKMVVPAHLCIFKREKVENTKHIGKMVYTIKVLE